MAHLIATSNRISFAKFAEQTQIPVDAVSEMRKEAHRISFQLPAGNWRDLKDQAEEALAFLRRWEAELSAFAQAFEPDDFWLQFVLLSRLDKVIIQNDHLPAELIQLASRIGLSIGFSTQTRESISDL